MIRVVDVRGLRTAAERSGIVYVGREFAGWPGHPLANSFRLREYSSNARTAAEYAEAREGHLADILDRYTHWLLARPSFEADLAALWEETDHGGKPLGCWCANSVVGDGSPRVCHAQILAGLLAERFGTGG